MRKVSIFGAVLLLALVVGACAPAPATEPTVSVPVTGDTATPAETPVVPVIATETDLPAEGTAEVPEGSPTVDPNDVGQEPGTMLSLTSSDNISQPYLVNQEGWPVYLFTMDTQGAGTSACVGECENQWQPVIVTEMPQAGEGVDANMFGTITREDGNMQATYNGWPLYYFAGDLAPGDTSGQGLNEVWFLVNASGEPIEQ